MSNGVTPGCLPKGMLVAAWTGPVKGAVHACVRACVRKDWVVVYLCACVASDEISHLCMRWQGKVDRSQVIQCISLVGETGDEDTCYQTVQP